MPKNKEGNIIWLASYLKSGNTWMRVFLNNLLSDQDEPVSINDLHRTGHIASNRRFFDEMVGVDSADMLEKEIDFYLPKAYKLWSSQLAKKEFIKTHYAFIKNEQGQWLFPLDATYKVIYLIRNPLDVCVSFAYHSGHTNFDKVINSMANIQKRLAQSKRRQANQLHQFIGNWSHHVDSWTNIAPAKVLVVRYEDLIQSPQETFTKVVHFLNLDFTSKQIEKAIEYSKLDNLKKMEAMQGFGEKSEKATLFFRKGTIGSWREELTKDQAKIILKYHALVMRRFNYLNSKEQLTI